MVLSDAEGFLAVASSVLLTMLHFSHKTGRFDISVLGFL